MITEKKLITLALFPMMWKATKVLILLLSAHQANTASATSKQPQGNQPVTLSIGDVLYDQGAEGAYVCVTMDWWPANKCDYNVCPWANASILTAGLEDDNGRLVHLLQAFQGVTLRLGGTQADTIVYEDHEADCLPFEPAHQPSHIFKHGCLTRQRWREFSEFARQSQARIIFGINFMAGRQHNSSRPWDAANARHFLKFLRDEQLADQIVGLELGNELNYRNITAKQHAEGFRQLHELVQQVFGSGNKFQLLGPDSGGWRDDYYREFLPRVQHLLSAITWHAYPLGPGKIQASHLVQKMMNASHLDAWGNQTAWVRQRYPRLHLAMGETGGAYNSGHDEVTNRFVDAFWYLNALGGLATKQHQLFCRQTLIGGNYGLVNQTSHYPNPSYFAAYLFHRIMGRQVRQVGLSDSTTIRAFVHCNLQQQRLGLLVLNYSNSTQATISLAAYDAHELVPRQEYHMTAHHLQASTVLCNNKEIVVHPNGTFHLAPKKVEGDDLEEITVEPQSYTFVQFGKDSILSQRECLPHETFRTTSL